MKEKQERCTDLANLRVVPGGETGVDELLLCYEVSVLVIRNLVKRNLEGNR